MTNQYVKNSKSDNTFILLFSRLSMVLILAMYLTGCDASQTISSETELNQNGITASALNLDADRKFEETDSDLIKMVRRATARYHSTTQALNAGYAEAEHCVDHPELGGMGYHWVNGPLVDPEFDITRPEALLYEADSNGNFKLVGVEYIVIDIDQDHPHFGDYPFDVGGTPIEAPHWSLHVWLYKPNPNGLFTPFNPNVSC